MTTKEEKLMNLVTEILGCGYADLEVALQSKYDFEDIMQVVRDNFGEFSSDVNEIIHSIMMLGLNDMTNHIEEAIGKIESDEEAEKIREINFDPFEDFETFTNSLDSHVWFRNNEEEYRKYFPEALKEFEENTGFVL